MTFAQKILMNERIRQLCISALGDGSVLDEALEAIYCEGFMDTPQMDGAGKLFVQRLKAVRLEYKAQLDTFLEDPKAWEQRQLQLAEDPHAMVCGLAMLAGLVQGSAWEKKECDKLLAQRMANKQTTREQELELFQLLVRTPMPSVFAGGQVPRLDPETVPQFAGILAMCTYVFAKREPDTEILPDISFDAVCIWSNAMTDVLCVCDGANANAAAVVGCVMTAQYMHIFQWDVLKGCIESVYKLSQPTMKNIMDHMRFALLQNTEAHGKRYPTEWVYPEIQDRDFYQCLVLLRKQRDSAVPQENIDNSSEENEYDKTSEDAEEE